MSEILKNAEVNSVTAKLRVVPEDKQFRNEILELTNVQMGTTDRWTVTYKSSLQDYQWRWTEKLIFSLGSDSVIATESFDNTLAEMRKRETADRKVELKATLRPVGITDPSNPLFINCNLQKRIVESKTLGKYYYAHRIEYRRCDEGRLTETDLIALCNLRCGQLNRVTGQPGDFVAEYYYEVDSSG